MTASEFRNSVIPFSRKIYPMLNRILRDEEETRDAIQELMLKLWKNRNELENCKNRNAYIIAVAKNYCFDLLKKKRPKTFRENEKHKILNLEAHAVNEEMKEKYFHVEKIINNLPDNFRQVIQLRDIDGFTFEEISEMTGFKISNIRVILSRARKKVKEEVEKIYNYEDTKQLTR